MPDDQWANTGSTNNTDYLGVDFGYQRPVGEVKICTYDDGQNVRAPQSLDVQYLSGSTWTSVRAVAVRRSLLRPGRRR